MNAEETTARTAIIAMAQNLGVGQYASQLCPNCSGGSSKERTLSINVEENGVIKFNCFRASCGFSGTAYSSPAIRRKTDSERPAASHLTPLTEDLHALSEREIKFFEETYGLNHDTITANIYRTDVRYALPILDPDGGRRGYITRRPYGGSPADTEASRNDPRYSSKALTYIETEGPVQSWYITEWDDPEYIGTIIVEDMISAMRLYDWAIKQKQTQIAAVAIMGTGVNAEKIREIQRVSRSSRVAFALDADATGAAFAMCRKWGAAFYSPRVIVLSKDFKSMTDDEIGDTLT